MYPNPASSTVRVSRGASSTAVAFVELISAGGKYVASWPMNGDQRELDVSGFAAGMYTLQLQTADGEAVQVPMLIQR